MSMLLLDTGVSWVQVSLLIDSSSILTGLITTMSINEYYRGLLILMIVISPVKMRMLLSM